MAAEIIAPYGTAVAVSEAWSAVAQSELYSTDVMAHALSMPEYKGAYEVTPSSEAQVLPTEGLMMRGDLTVGAIPSNYGLVTWDGSVITVS